MSLLEWVRVAEDAREQQDDERVATGLESLRTAVGELVPLDRVALIAVDSPERARNEIRAACRRLSTRDPWKALAPAVFRDLVEGLISTVFGLGPLEDLIADETVTEIMVNGTDSVYVERDGRLSRASVGFESDEQVRALIDRILGCLWAGGSTNRRPWPAPACLRAIASTRCCRRSPSMGRCLPFAPSHGAS